MDAKQEQIELFVAEATQSLGGVRRSLEVVALGNAELSSAVVGMARSLGETAARLDLAEMAEICALVTAELPQVVMEELPQRERWEPLFEALQMAVDAVATGSMPSVREIRAAIARLKGEWVDAVRGDELEDSYAEMGLVEFALEPDLFAGGAEPAATGEREETVAKSDWFENFENTENTAVESGDWLAAEAEGAFSTTEDLFAVGEAESEEGVGELLFNDTALFASESTLESMPESEAFGLLDDVLGAEAAVVEDVAGMDWTAAVSEDGGEEKREPFEFDEGLMASLTEPQASAAGLDEFSGFGDMFEAEVETATATAGSADDFAVLGEAFEASGESADMEGRSAIDAEAVADGSELDGVGEGIEVTAQDLQGTETEDVVVEGDDFAALAEAFEASGEEPAAVASERPATEAVAEGVEEVSEFPDFGEMFGENSEGGEEELAGLAELGEITGAQFSELDEVFGEAPAQAVTLELEFSALREAVGEDAEEEVTEFPDFEAVFGEAGGVLEAMGTREPGLADSLETSLVGPLPKSLSGDLSGSMEPSAEPSEPELDLELAGVLSEIEAIDEESGSVKDLADLEGLFGDGLCETSPEVDGALAGLHLDSEPENQALEVSLESQSAADWGADLGGEETPEEDLGLGELFDGLSDADIVAIAGSPEERGSGEFAEVDELENFLGEAGVGTGDGESNPTLDALSDYFDSSFGEEGTDTPLTATETAEDLALENLEGLLADSLKTEVSGLESLDSLLGDTGSTGTPVADDFADLSSMLDSTIGRASTPTSRPLVSNDGKKASQRSTAMKVKVDVTYLDNLNNLVGELVVNRNLLASDSERMQGFISNLLNQVQLLSEVSQKMRDTFDRSVLETSVIANRPRGFSGFQQMLVVDRPGGDSNNPHDIRSRFTGDTFDTYNEYHILSQEIIELIVKIKESTSDIEFVVSETEQVTRQLGTITTQVQDNLKQLRMLPFSQLTDRLPRGVRDRALQANKKAEITFEGTDTLIDKAILEQLQDPMVHLVNNAIDHGIEDPETRRQRGKPEVGQLTVRAYHQGNQTVITVSDDGGGIDPEKVKQSAVRKGLLTPAEAAKLSDAEAFNLIFRPGFSTAAVADMYKGRGVGMDVVKSSIEEIRGSILTESEVGKGTTFTIRLPLTLSITKAMTCVSNRNKIAFPVDSVEDMLEIPRNQIQLNSKGEPTLPWRDTMLPFLPLSSLLTYNRQISRGSVYGKQDDEILSILVLRNDNNFLALQTDQIIGESEIVIKQLEGPVPQPPGIAGATILGDGRVMAIANVLELFDIASGRLRFKFDVAEPPQEVDEQHDPVVLIVDDSITVRELLSVTFSKVGYRVEQARDGQDAWDKLRSGLPCDLIFCDIEMPKMDGLELLSRVKKDENLKKIPMAMLTSRGADRHRQTARELGANGYFTKPYLEEEVITASKRLLKGEYLLDSHS